MDKKVLTKEGYNKLKEELDYLKNEKRVVINYIDNFYSDNLFSLDNKRKPFPEIFDEELKFIDDLFDNEIINNLLAPPNYSASHRSIKPYQLFRMEILKVIKYPEISYRKFCTDEYFGRERKQNRRFVRLG